MIKRKYIKKLYIEEAYCDKCGSKLVPDTYILMSNPPQYPYICSKCDERYIFKENEKPDSKLNDNKQGAFQKVARHANVKNHANRIYRKG